MVDYQTLKSKESNIVVDTSIAAVSAILVKIILTPFITIPLQQNLNHQQLVKQDNSLRLWKLGLKNISKYMRNQALLFTIKDYISRIWLGSHQSITYQHYLLQKFMSGGLAGSISLLILYPLSYHKINHVHFLANRNQKMCQQPNGIVQKYKSMYNNSLIREVYRGAASGTILTFIYRGLYFRIYDSLKPYILYKQKNRRIKRLLLALSASSIASWTSNPIYSISRQLFVNSGKVDFWSVLTKYRERINSVWIGANKNCFSICNAGLILFIYDQLHQFRKYTMESV